MVMVWVSYGPHSHFPLFWVTVVICLFICVADEEENDPGQDGRETEGKERPRQRITTTILGHAIGDINAEKEGKDKSDSRDKEPQEDHTCYRHSGKESDKKVRHREKEIFHNCAILQIWVQR